MLRGFTFSTLIHATVLAAAIMSWPQEQNACDRQIEQLKRDEPGLSEIDILMRLPHCASVIDVPIDIVDIGLVTDIAPVARVEEAPEEEPEEAEPEEQPDPVEDVVPEEEEDVVEEEVEDTETREAESQPEEVVVEDPEAEPEEKPEEVEEKKPEPKTEEPDLIRRQKPKTEESDGLDFDVFEDILKNKAEEQRKAAAEKAPPPINKPVLKDAQQPRKGAGERRANTASLQAALRRQIGYCWNGVEDLPKEDQIDVVISVQLKIDGTLDGSAKLVSPRRRPVGRSGIPVDLALRAVRQCAPYKLPEDDYEEWKDIEVTIGPLK